MAIIDLYDHLFPPYEDVEYGLMAEVSKDERRIIQEFNFLGSSWQRFTINMKPAKPLGQHFHEFKNEEFFFLLGGGVVRLAHVNRQGQIIGEIKHRGVAPGSVIKIPAYTTHRFDLDANTEFVARSSKPFDPNNKDLNICPIPD